MAAAVSLAGGTHGTSGSWVGGVIPGANDTATVSHPIVADDARILGTSGVAGGTAALTVNTGGSYTIATTGSLQARGDIALNGGGFFGNGVGTFEWDSSLAASPTTTGYSMNFLSENANSRVEFAGTSDAARFTVSSVTTGGARGGRFNGQAALACFKFKATYTNISNLGVGGGTFDAISCDGFSGIQFVIENVLIDTTVARVLPILAGGGDLSVRNVQYNSAERFFTGGSGALGANRREFVNSVFNCDFWTFAANATYQNVKLKGWTISDGSIASTAVWENVFVDFNTGNGSPLTDFDVNAPGGISGRTYMLHANPLLNNPHYLVTAAVQAAKTVVKDQWIVQSASPDSAGGDIFLLGNQVGRRVDFRRCLGLPNWGGVNCSGAFLGANGGSGAIATKFRVEHCTIFTSAFFAGAIYIGESGAAVDEIGDSIRSNIFHQAAPGNGVVLFREQGANPVLVGARVGYNTKYRYTGSIAGAVTGAQGYVGQNAGALSTDPLDALTTDDNEDPGFVDATRDIRSFARSLGFVGTDAEVVNLLRAALDAAPNPADPNYLADATIPNMITHTQGGVIPTNIALQSAHDAEVGGWRGAMTGTSPAVLTLEFDVQPSDTASGNPIAPAVTVRALSDGVLNAAFTGAVTIAIVGLGSSLYGTLTVNAVGGVATFANAVPGGTGGTYVLEATAAGYDGATSDNFTVTSGGGSSGGGASAGVMIRALTDGELEPSRKKVALHVFGADNRPYNADGKSVLISTAFGAEVPGDATLVRIGGSLHTYELSDAEAAAADAGDIIAVRLEEEVGVHGEAIGYFEVYLDDPFEDIPDTFNANMVSVDDTPTTAISELAAAPPIDGVGLLEMIRWIYHTLRNTQNITDDSKVLMRADGVTPLATQDLADDGTTFTADAAT